MGSKDRDMNEAPNGIFFIPGLVPNPALSHTTELQFLGRDTCLEAEDMLCMQKVQGPWLEKDQVAGDGKCPRFQRAAVSSDIHGLLDQSFSTWFQIKRYL